MIRITVEMIKWGIAPPKTIATAHIMNRGDGTRTRGNYVCTFNLIRKKGWRIANVLNFPRKSKNVWYLIYEALKNGIEVEEVDAPGCQPGGSGFDSRRSRQKKK